MQITIDREFEALIPPMPAEDRTQLEKNLQADGCRDRLVIWHTEGKSILVDGHNRYEICNRLSIPYRTMEMQFGGRREARIWIRNNQLGRRNITDGWRIELALGNKADLAAIGKEKMKESGGVGGSAKASEVKGLSITDKPLANQAIDTNPAPATPQPDAKPQAQAEPKTGPTAAPRPTPTQPPPKATPTPPPPAPKPPPAPHDTRKEIAKEVGVSTGKLAQAEVVRNQSPALWEKAKEGEITINAAYTEIKRKEKAEKARAERVEKIAEISKGNEELKGDTLYPVIYADPPWRYDYTKADNRAIENQYPTMTLDDICALKVPATDDAVLFLWTTSPKLEEGLRVVREWGFTYRTCAVWDKQKIGMGYYFRQQHEILLVATKGSIPTPEPANRPGSVFRFPRGNHSAKPGEVAVMIEAMYPEYPKLEMFCRDPRNGWGVWGNQSNG